MVANKYLQSRESVCRIDDVNTVSLEAPTGIGAGYRVLIANTDVGDSSGLGVGDFTGHTGEIAVFQPDGTWAFEDQTYYPKEQLIYAKDSKSIWSYEKGTTTERTFTIGSTYRKYLKILDTVVLGAQAFGSTFASRISNFVFYDDNGTAFDQADWRIKTFTRDGTTFDGDWPVTQSVAWGRNAYGFITFEYIGSTIESGISRISHDSVSTRIFQVDVNYADDTPTETRNLGATNVYDKSFTPIEFLALEGGTVHIDERTIQTVQAGIGTDVEIGIHRNPKNIHINSNANLVTWNVDNSSDGEYHYVMNTGNDDHEVVFSGGSLVATFTRDGVANNAAPANTIPVKAGESWLLHVTDNGGNKFVNATKLGGGSSVTEVAGQFSGTVSDKAAMDAITTLPDGSDVSNGDIAYLDTDDIGSGTTASPEFEKGYYQATVAAGVTTWSWLYNPSAELQTFDVNLISITTEASGAADTTVVPYGKVVANSDRIVSISEIPSDEEIATITGTNSDVTYFGDKIVLISNVSGNVDLTVTTRKIPLYETYGKLGKIEFYPSGTRSSNLHLACDGQVTDDFDPNFLQKVQAGEIQGVIDNGDGTVTMPNLNEIGANTGGLALMGAGDGAIGSVEASQNKSHSHTYYRKNDGGSGSAGRTTAVEYSVADFERSVGGSNVQTAVEGGTEAHPRRFNGKFYMVVRVDLVPVKVEAGGTLNIVSPLREYNVTNNGGPIIGKAVVEHSRLIQVPLSAIDRRLITATLNATNVAEPAIVIHEGVGGFAYVMVKSDDAGVIDLTYTEGNISTGSDSLQHFSGNVENQDGTTGYVWNTETQSGTAITKSGDSKEFTLAAGFTYDIHYLPIRGQANAQFINVGYFIDGALNDSFFAISGDDGNWEGGGGYRDILTVGDTEPAKTIHFKRNSSSGNGNHSAKLFIKVIAKSEQTSMPELFNQRNILSNGAALPSPRIGYDNVTTIVEIPIAATNKGLVLDAASIAAGHNLLYPGRGGHSDAVVSVTPAGNDVDITWTEGDVLDTFKGMQQIGSFEVNPVYTLGTSLGGNINTGIDFTNVDFFTVTFEDTNTTHGYSHWYDLREGKTKFWFWGYSGETSHAEIHLKDKASGIFDFRRGGSRVLKVQRIDAYAEADNGYVIPTGTTLATPRNVTHNGAALSPAKQVPEGTTAIIPIPIADAGKALEVTPTAEYSLIDAGYGGERPALVSVSMGATDVDIISTLVDVVKVKDALHRVGEYRPATSIEINNTTFNTTMDLSNVDLLFVIFSDADATARRHTGWFDIRDGHSDHFYWNHDNAYCTIFVEDLPTGRIRITDATRNTKVVAIEAFRYADQQYVVPDTYTVLENFNVTVAGATLANGGTTASVFKDLAAELTLDIPNDKIISSVSIDNGVASVKDAIQGLVSITISSDATLTVTTADKNSKAELVFEGNIIDTPYNTHGTVKPGARSTATTDNGSGIDYDDTSGIFTITREMTINFGVRITNSEGGGLQIWPRVMVAMGGRNYRSLGIPDSAFSNPSAGVNTWFSQGTMRVSPGTSLYFQNRVNQNYPGTRNGSVWIKELD